MMNGAARIDVEHRWECPNCIATDVTREQRPHTRFHICRANGMLTPMVPAGTRCKVELVEREDYVGRERVRVAPDGKVYMSAVVVRDDGMDCAVYAPTARADREEVAA